jgi:cell division protein FtsX
MNFFTSHYQMLLKALQRSHASMLSTLMMFLVIGITFILPSISFLIVQNLKSISESIQHESQISVFLKKETPIDIKNKIEKELKNRSEINNYHFVKKKRLGLNFKNQWALMIQIMGYPKIHCPMHSLSRPTPLIQIKLQT